jgi:hypothetical protein
MESAQPWLLCVVREQDRKQETFPQCSDHAVTLRQHAGVPSRK